MHIALLIMSYAFSGWMLYDAFKRGARYWWIIIIFVPFGEFIYFFVVKFPELKERFKKRVQTTTMHSDRGNDGRPGSAPAGKIKCKSCIYCEEIDNEGVVCLKGGTRKFIPKNHIGICYDYERKQGWFL